MNWTACWVLTEQPRDLEQDGDANGVVGRTRNVWATRIRADPILMRADDERRLSKGSIAAIALTDDQCPPEHTGDVLERRR
jgi:hypothetical protein